LAGLIKIPNLALSKLLFKISQKPRQQMGKEFYRFGGSPGILTPLHPVKKWKN